MACPGTTGIASPSTLRTPRAFEDDVHLVVRVRLLPVRLGRDEDVDADLEPGRGVHDLVPAVPGLEAPSHLLDLEGVSRQAHRTGCSSERLPLRVVSSTFQVTVDSTATTPGTRATKRSSRSTSLLVWSRPLSAARPSCTLTSTLPVSIHIVRSRTSSLSSRSISASVRVKARTRSARVTIPTSSPSFTTGSRLT